MKVIVFFIVFFAFACRTPRRAEVLPQVEVKPSTEVIFENKIEVPSSTAVTVVEWPEASRDTVLLQLENAWVELIKLRNEKDSLLSVRVTTKPVFITQTDTLLATYYTTEDSTGAVSIWQVIEGDTNQVATVRPGSIQVPGPEIPEDGSFPWGVALTFMAALMFWLINKRPPRRKVIS